MPRDAEHFAVRSVRDDPAEETERSLGKKPPETPLDRAKRLATEYLRNPHSEKELRDRLREKAVSDADIETVTALCLDYGFLNDADYAGTIVRHYAARGYGAGRIRQELLRRGVPKELWDEALDEFLPKPEETIDRLLSARLRGKDASDRRERDKAANYLFRRGYAWPDIRAALNRYGAEDDFDE